MPRFEVTVQPNTSRDTPVSKILPVYQSEINLVKIHIPRGHAYLTGIQMYAGRGGSILIPPLESNVKWVRGNGSDSVYTVHIQLDPPQYYIELRGYNEDDTYVHTFYVDLE